MKLAFRSHLPTHEMTIQDVGGGIARSTCIICPHVEIHDAPTAAQRTEDWDLPEWITGSDDTHAPVRSLRSRFERKLVAA